MSAKKELSISAIKDGTVIDHIPADAVFQVADILALQKEKNMVSVATNLASKAMGKKGIVKIGSKQLSKDEFNKIVIVAPKATVNIIRSYTVKKKLHVMLPEKIKNIIKCSNPSCITNSEDIGTTFYVLQKDPLKVKCHYCERFMHKEDITIL